MSAMDDNNDRRFVPTEKLLCDILVPAGREAVVIRAQGVKVFELVRTADGISKDSLILFVSASLLRALLARLIVLGVISPRGLKAVGTYVVIPSTDQPKTIVPWWGKASRIYFRNEAASPCNSPAKYLTKWLLASLGIAPLLQHGFVILCDHD